MSGDSDSPSRYPRCEILQRLGIDPRDREDVASLAEDLRWVRRERLDHVQREIDRRADRRDRRARLYSVGLGFLATAIGGVCTWLISHPPALFLFGH